MKFILLILPVAVTLQMNAQATLSKTSQAAKSTSLNVIDVAPVVLVPLTIDGMVQSSTEKKAVVVEKAAPAIKLEEVTLTKECVRLTDEMLKQLSVQKRSMEIVEKKEEIKLIEVDVPPVQLIPYKKD